MEEKQTIEQSLRRLEEIVERLGEDTVSLDDSLTLFFRGDEALPAVHEAAGRGGTDR